jgi:DNA-binding transcriptional ArsR family regulator
MKEAKAIENAYRISSKNAELMLRIINNPIAQKILTYIWKDEAYVNSITEAIGEPQCVCSLHLRKLFKLGLVDSRREWKHVYYKANIERFRRLNEILQQANSLFQKDNEKKKSKRLDKNSFNEALSWYKND